MDTEQLPTECLVCRDNDGHIITADCPNRCDNGLIHPDQDDQR